MSKNTSDKVDEVNYYCEESIRDLIEMAPDDTLEDGAEVINVIEKDKTAVNISYNLSGIMSESFNTDLQDNSSVSSICDSLLRPSKASKGTITDITDNEDSDDSEYSDFRIKFEGVYKPEATLQ